MASKTTATSQHIMEQIGGAENVNSLTHCATRLRFQLHDQSAVDVDKLESDPAVLGVVKQGSTGLQVVMGGGVADYYQDITRLPEMKNKAGGDSDEAGSGSATAAATSKKSYDGVRGKYSWIDYSFEFLSDTFRPVLWALLGASLIITILVLFDTFGVQEFRFDDPSEVPPTFLFLHAMYRSVFYFLPIMVGATAAKKLGANEWIGAAIPAALLTPEFISLGDQARDVATAVEGESAHIVEVFGLPMYINDYGGQVLPPILAAIGLYWVEKGLKKIIPSAVHMVFVPFFSLLVMIPATAFVVGPFGIWIGNGISNLLFAVNDFSPFILAILIPLLYPFLVPLGLHWPLNAIMIQNINTLGFDFIQGPMGAWNFACFGVVTGVLVISIMEKNKSMRQVSLGGSMAGLLGGISEPSLYGLLLRFRRSYLRLLPGCLVGGIIAGIFNIKAYAFVFTSVLTVPAMDPWGGYVLAIGAAFGVSFALTVAFDYRTKEEKATVRAQIAAERGEQQRIDAGEDTSSLAEEQAPAQAPASTGGTAVATALQSGAVTRLGAPLSGRLLDLSETPDPAFAQGSLGNGVAIEPDGGSIFAPAAGKILTVQKTGHAVGLKLDSGIELLIHIGIDTVQMGGEGFEVHVEKKQRVEAGDKLISFDTSAIEAAGYSTITPIIVVNTRKFDEVAPARETGGMVRPGEDILEVTAPTSLD